MEFVKHHLLIIQTGMRSIHLQASLAFVTVCIFFFIYWLYRQYAMNSLETAPDPLFLRDPSNERVGSWWQSAKVGIAVWVILLVTDAFYKRTRSWWQSGLVGIGAWATARASAEYDSYCGTALGQSIVSLSIVPMAAPATPGGCAVRAAVALMGAAMTGIIATNT
jgi:hypothetical protein